jgi:hypothetical protein
MKTKENNKQNQESFVYLKKWLTQNKNVNLLTAMLNDSASVDAMNWKKLEDHKAEIIPQLKAYQRLIKILPRKNNKLILDLIGANIHSAIQVASMPKQNFIKTYSHLFSKKEAAAEEFYNKALAIKTQLLLKHVQRIS